jgi:exopolysaccharide biosynthesis polyprenyl glycosylphosphotransferase
VTLRKIQKFKFVIADFLAAFLAWIIFLQLLQNNQEVSGGFLNSRLLLEGGLISAFWVVLYFLLGLYRNIFRKSRVKEIFILARLSLLGGIIIFFALLLHDESFQNYRYYYRTIFTYFLLHFLISAILKLLVITHTQALVRRRAISFNTLIIGSNFNAREVYQELEKNNRHLGLLIKGFVQVFEPRSNSFQQDLVTLGNYKELPQIIKQLQIEEVIIAIEPSEHKQIEEILGLLEGQNVRISILPDLYQILLGSVRVYHLFGTPLIEIKHNLMPVWQEVTKRVSDIFISLLMLVLLLPVYLFTALMVKLSSPGPVFYGQERIGKGGVPFIIYKFRSMCQNAEQNGPALSCDNDPRITPWGRYMRKTRLDELPQFYNVLIGNMSLVGPRPERKYFIDQLIKVAPHYKHLLLVRPGITSLGLVKFGYAQNLEEMVKRLKYDILYIENMSLAMDFRVILYTIKVIVEGRGK